jgi:hypothetical protein
MIKLKRGYDKGLRTIEFTEGNVDLVLYNNKETSFYFFRLEPNDLVEQGFVNSDFIYPESDMSYADVVEEYLAKFKVDYYTLCEQLLRFATENNYKERYEM